MNDEQLRIFLRVADCGSFSKAEKDSYISKQAMIKQMKSLEAEVRVPLFVRSRTGIALTPSGKIFYEGAGRLLAEERTLLNEVRAAGKREVVRIGNVEHQVLLNPVNAAFIARYPEIELQRVVHPNHGGEWRVENGVQDVAETFLEAAKTAPHCRYLRLTDVPYVAAMGRNHPLSGRKSVSLRQLSGYVTLIFPPMLRQEYLRAIRAAFAERPKNLVERQDVDNQVGAAWTCVTSGQILLTANPFIRSIPELVLIPLNTGWQREYGILYPGHPSSAVEKYVALAKELYQGGGKGQKEQRKHGQEAQQAGPE